MADNALAKQVGKKLPQRRKTRLEQIADEIEAYGGRVRDDFLAGAERSAQGLGDIVERGDVLTGIPRLALGGTSWMGAPVSAALSPILGPILQPVGEAVNTYVGQPVEDLTGYPADITNDLAMTGLTLGAVKGLGMTRPYLARAADQVEGMANRAGYTLRKPANVYGSGPTLTPLVDEADGGLIAYHGSPHTFDKFSMDKIGTGEGAQAYGHGLYFAEAEDVAKTYRDALAPKANVSAGGAPLTRDMIKSIADELELPQSGSAAANAFGRLSTSNSIDDYLKKLAEIDTNELRKTFPKVAAEIETERRLVAELKARGLDIDRPNKGSMYQVRLNVKPDELLDWDMPLSEQPQAIQSAIRNTGAGTHRESSWFGPQKPMGGPTHWVNNGTFVRETPSGYEYGRGSAWDAKAEGLAKTLEEAQAKATVVPVPKIGREVFSDLDRTQPRVAHPETTRKLKEAGIKGIRYKDAGSRQIEGGTYNYVIFDDSLIDILKRYGIPMTAAAGGGMMVIGQDMPPEVASQIGG